MTELSTDESCAFVLKDTSTPALEEPWHCPHDAVEGHKRCVFHHTESEREAIGISERDVHRQFEAAIESGDPDRRAFVGATLPSLEFDHADFDHDDQYLLDLRHACVLGDFVATHARFEEAVDLRDAKLDGFRARDAIFRDGLRCQRATFEGEVNCCSGTFRGDDVVFTGATFEDTVRFNQATFSHTAIFEDATFTEEATFLGSEFHGRGIDIDDYSSFGSATFEDVVRFDYAVFEAASFEDTQFTDVAHFEEATTTAPVRFARTHFESRAIFDGMTFEDDASFLDASFEGEADFRGVTFEGGGTVLHHDADFSGAHFARTVRFESGDIGATSFEETVFEDDACFRDVLFQEQVTFNGAAFAGDAVFDAATFDDEVTFEGVTFEGLASYPGVEFEGSNNHDSASVTFDDVVFEGDANFHHAWCTSASFWDVHFENEACFTESKFTKHIDLKVSQNGGNTVVNFTDAILADGEIVQSEGRLLRYDLTTATVGSVVFSVEDTAYRDLFMHIRFCDTTFENFDFTAHAQYLSRSNWNLHEFDDDDIEYEYAVEMTPLATEKTYQRAKICASSNGNVEASGKFRFKRQQYARQNYKSITLDSKQPLLTRIRNSQRVAENLFLDVTCGHGMRLYRITAVFLFFPVFPALLYTFGGPSFRTSAGQIHSLADIFTMGGIETFVANVHFSYITYLTIGYGNVVAEGNFGLVLVSMEAYASVILGGLFIYVLVKRSEL